MRRWPSGWALAFQASQTGPTPVRRSMISYIRRLMGSLPAPTRLFTVRLGADVPLETLQDNCCHAAD